MSRPITSLAPLWSEHPPQLKSLFLVEMWERFGYFGMRGLLVLFLSQHFLFSDAAASGLYGGFTSLAYLTPLAGGLLADLCLGRKTAVRLGAMLMAAGYFGLCFSGEAAKPAFMFDGIAYAVMTSSAGESKPCVVIDASCHAVSTQADGSVVLEGLDDSRFPARFAAGSYSFDGIREPLRVSILLLSLSAIIIGSGLFKPNMSPMLGSLYSQDDPRRDSGFTLFHLGVNLGSLGAQFLCPWFAHWFGWWAGFLIAALGLLMSLLLLHRGAHSLQGIGDPPPVARSVYNASLIAVLVAIPVVWFLLNNLMQSADSRQQSLEPGGGWVFWSTLPLLGKVLLVTFTASSLGILGYAVLAGQREELKRMVAAMVLTLFSVVFWALFEQAGSTLTFFADRNVDRNVLGLFEMPAGQVQIFNPLFVVLLATLFSTLWMRLDRRGLNPSVANKFALALFQLGLAFLILVLGAQYASAEYRVGLSWVVFAYLLISTGELCLAPIGSSMITRMAMARIVGLMMGVWWLSSSIAQYLSGLIAQAAAVETIAGVILDRQASLETYSGVFTFNAVLAFATGAVLLLLGPWLQSFMGDRDRAYKSAQEVA